MTLYHTARASPMPRRPQRVFVCVFMRKLLWLSGGLSVAAPSLIVPGSGVGEGEPREGRGSD